MADEKDKPSLDGMGDFQERTGGVSALRALYEKKPNSGEVKKPSGKPLLAKGIVDNHLNKPDESVNDDSNNHPPAKKVFQGAKIVEQPLQVNSVVDENKDVDPSHASEHKDPENTRTSTPEPVGKRKPTKPKLVEKTVIEDGIVYHKKDTTYIGLSEVGKNQKKHSKRKRLSSSLEDQDNDIEKNDDSSLKDIAYELDVTVKHLKDEIDGEKMRNMYNQTNRSGIKINSPIFIFNNDGRCYFNKKAFRLLMKQDNGMEEFIARLTDEYQESKDQSKYTDIKNIVIAIKLKISESESEAKGPKKSEKSDLNSKSSSRRRPQGGLVSS